MQDPIRFEEIQEVINGYNTVVSFFKENKGSLAYVLKREKDISSSYKVFCLDDDEIKKYLLIHEFGHIYYGHLNNELSKKEIIKSQLKFIMPELHGMDEEKFMNIYSSYLDNVTKDMEVNSKVFTKEEFENFENHLKEKIDPNITLIWPERYDFPVNLNSSTYLLLIMKDLEKFMNNDMNKNGEQNDGGDGEEQEKNGNSSQNENKKSDNKSGQKKNKKLTKEEFEKYLEEVAKHVEEEDKKVRSDNNDDDDDGLTKITLDWSDHEPWEYGKTGEEVLEIEEVKKILDMSQLEEILLKKYKKVIKTKNKSDMFYNYNRRKYGSNIIIPKIRQDYRKEVSSDYFYILYDVSGSIPVSLTNSFINMVRNISYKFHKKTRVILWNTVCKGDFLINEDIPLIGGGGNDLASGIDYINEKYNLKPNDYVFVISDFYDDLPLMNNSFKKMKARKFGIKWFNTNTEDAKQTTERLRENFEKSFDFELVSPGEC